MTEYEFTLVLSGITELSPRVLDALHDSGCDDALIGMRDGVAFADFSREAPSFREAVLSAISDIERAGVGARVEHIEPDELVSMSEVARRLGVSREGVRKWVTGQRGPGSFPTPVGSVKERSPLWRWTDVIRWYQSRADPGGELDHAKTGSETPIEQSENKGRSTRTSKRSGSTVRQKKRGLYTDNQVILAGPDIAPLNAALDLRRHVSLSEAMKLLRRLSAGSS